MRDFSIGEAATATGLGESTLRMWEARHGFPSPKRRVSGHRRYSEAEVEALRRAVSLRRAGLSLPLAIERSRQPIEGTRSLHAMLRADHPELELQTLSRRVLLALTHAIEDETCARAERPVMFGSFQRERFYRHEEQRWRQFFATAELVCVFADFKRVKTPARAPIEIPLRPGDHLGREWSIVCDAPGYSVCLSAWEPPRKSEAGAERTLETIWSVEPGIVRSATRACASMAHASIPDVVESLQGRLDGPAGPATDEQLRLAAAITGRTLAALV